jgi:hypothetical protein
LPQGLLGFAAADNGLQGLLAGPGAGCGGVCAANLDGMEEQRPDSGSPIESFLTFFLSSAADPMNAIYPLAGLVTAVPYWWLGAWRQDRS